MAVSTGDIETIQAFTGCSPGQGEQFIARYGNVEAAVNAWFEHGGTLPPETAQAAWNEDHFHQSDDQQYGPLNKPSVPSFNIESSDNLNPNVYSHQTMSRPPSRASNYGTHTPKEVDADADMQQAMANSMTEHSAGQEMGVIGGGGNFKPATQSYYDNDSWAMVPTSAQEFVDNPEPKKRLREPGVPVVMRPTITGSFVSGLLPILHSIPLAREALLARGKLVTDYGRDDHWWDGHTQLEVPKIVVISGGHPPDTAWEDMIYEMQRLIAFMDETERAYGNVDNLIKTASSNGCWDDGPGGILRTWHRAVKRAIPGESLPDIFETVAYNDPTLADIDDPATQSIFAVDVTINETARQLGPSLYEQLDQILWSNDTDTEEHEPRSIHMEPGEILVFQAVSIDADLTGLNIDIPTVLYADRYLKENMDTVKQMRKKRMDLYKKVARVEEKQKKLKEVALPSNGNNYDTAELFEHAAEFMASIPDRESTIPSPQQDQLIDIDSHDRTFRYSDVAAELRRVAAKVTEKLQALEASKAAALAQLSAISSILTSPSPEPHLNPTHRYTLRGVTITTPSTTNSNANSTTNYTSSSSNTTTTTYILILPSPTNLIATDPFWHRTTFTPSAFEPITHAVVDEAEVIRAAQHDSRKALLVYASDRAITEISSSTSTNPPPPSSLKLPAQLHNFVRADNLIFDNELAEQERSEREGYAGINDYGVGGYGGTGDYAVGDYSTGTYAGMPTGVTGGGVAGRRGSGASLSSNQAQMDELDYGDKDDLRDWPNDEGVGLDADNDAHTDADMGMAWDTMGGAGGGAVPAASTASANRASRYQSANIMDDMQPVQGYNAAQGENAGREVRGFSDPPPYDEGIPPPVPRRPGGATSKGAAAEHVEEAATSSNR